MTDLIQTISAAVRALADDEGSPNAIVVLHNRDDLISKAALTAINEAGYAVVPREPSEEQTKAIMANVGFPVRAYRAAITTGETGQ